MVTIEEAKNALGKLFECYDQEMYEQAVVNNYILEEYLKQHEEKPKRIPHLLNNKP